MTKNNYINVGNAPVANFSGTPTIGAPPLAVSFTDSSTNSHRVVLELRGSQHLDGAEPEPYLHRGRRCTRSR